jgi:hypothetical protein
MVNINISSRKKLIIITVLVLAFFQSIFMEIFNSIKNVTYIYYFLNLLFAFAWIQYDNHDYQYKRTPLFNAGLLALFILFFPIYIYKTRRNVRSVIKYISSLLLIILLIGLFNMIGLICYSGVPIDIFTCIRDPNCTFSIGK